MKCQQWLHFYQQVLQKALLDSSLYLILAPSSADAAEMARQLFFHSKRPFQLISVEEASESVLQQIIAQDDLFSEAILWIDRVDLLKKNSINALCQPSLQKTVVLTGCSAKGLSFLYERARTNGVVVDLLDEKPWHKPTRLVQWIQYWATLEGKTIDDKAALLLLQYVGADAALLRMELQKMSCYVAEQKQIDMSVVTLLVAPTQAESGWNWAMSLLQKNWPVAWQQGRMQLQAGQPIQGLLALLRYQVQNSLKLEQLLKNGVESEELQKHFPHLRPGSKALATATLIATDLGALKLQKTLQVIFDLDHLSRSGTNDGFFLLDLLLAKIGSL